MFWKLSIFLSFIFIFIHENIEGELIGSRLLYVRPQNTIVQLDAKASFICRAQARSPPIISWKINGKHVNRSRYVITNGLGLLNGTSTLIINAVRQQENNSVITCIANSAGNLSDSANAKLIILNKENLQQGFPIFKDQTNSVRAVEKTYPALITCLVNGEPTPDLVWLKNSLPLETNTVKYNFSVPGSLLIRNADESDEGQYLCIATNTKGTAHSKALNLHVKVRRVRPQFSIRPKSSYSMPFGTTLELICAAVGHPIPKVSWKIMNPNDHRGLEPMIEGLGEAAVGRKTLKLTNLTKSIRLICVAESNLGQIETTTNVDVAMRDQSRHQDFIISENHDT